MKEKKQVTYAYCKYGACSRNSFWRGIQICIKYVPVFFLQSPAIQSACAIIHYLWHIWFYHTFSHCLIKTRFLNIFSEYKMCFDFVTNFIRNASHFEKNSARCYNNYGPDSSVGIATDYGLDGPGSNPGGDEIPPPPSKPALGPAQPPVKWVPGRSLE